MLAVYSRREQGWCVNDMRLASSDNLVLTLANMEYFLSLSVPQQELFYEIDEATRAIKKALRKSAKKANTTLEMYDDVPFEAIYAHFKRKPGVCVHKKKHYLTVLNSSACFVKSRVVSLIGKKTTLWKTNPKQHALSKKMRVSVQCIEVRAEEGKEPVCSVSYTSVKSEKQRIKAERSAIARKVAQENLSVNSTPESEKAEKEVAPKKEQEDIRKKEIKDMRRKVTEYIKTQNPHIRPALEGMGLKACADKEMREEMEAMDKVLRGQEKKDAKISVEEGRKRRSKIEIPKKDIFPEVVHDVVQIMPKKMQKHKKRKEKEESKWIAGTFSPNSEN